MFRHLVITGVAATVVGAVPTAALNAAPAGAASGTPVAPPVVASPVVAPPVVAPPVVAPSADAAARTALVASITALETTSHNVEMTTVRSIIHASLDPAGGSGTLTDEEGLSEFDETVVDGQVWLKLNIDPDTNKQLGISPDTWMSLDMNKLPKNNALPIPPHGSDPVDMPGILRGVTAARQNSANTFTGTIDLTKVSGRDRPDANEVRRAGAAAEHVPFTAMTDVANRITVFKVDARGFDPGLSADIKFTNYGADPKVKVPSLSVPAPDALYTLLAN